jgi:hypothetical protein
VARSDRLHHHETDVVAIADVIGARIAETDEEQHASPAQRRRIASGE